MNFIAAMLEAREKMGEVRTNLSAIYSPQYATMVEVTMKILCMSAELRGISQIPITPPALASTCSSLSTFLAHIATEVPTILNRGETEEDFNKVLVDVKIFSDILIEAYAKSR